MGFWDKTKEAFGSVNGEVRSTYNTGATAENTTTEETTGADSLSSLFVQDAVTEEMAMKIPAVNFAVETITSKIAQLPLKLYKQNEDGSVEEIVEDGRLRFLNEEANDFLNGYNLKKHMSKDVLFHGAAYVVIEEGNHAILGLHPLDSSSVTITKRVQNGFKTVGADISSSSNSKVKFKSHELIIAVQNSKDGLTPQFNGKLAQGQNIFKNAIGDMDMYRNYYNRGAFPLGMVETHAGTPLTEKQMTAMKTSWKNRFDGSKNSMSTIFLPPGTKYVPMGPLTLDDKQSEKHNRDICKFFGIPTGMMPGGEGSQYVSLVQNKQKFVEDTLMANILPIEEGINRALLLESEKRDGYYFRFDTSELIRGTEKERLEAAEIGVRSGILKLNEARKKFDAPDYKQDLVQFGSGIQLYDDKTGKFVTINQQDSVVEEAE